MGSELDPAIRREVESWSKPWQKLFLGICEDLEGCAEKAEIVEKAYQVITKRREGKKNGHKWWCDEQGVWTWGLQTGEPPF